MTFCSKGCLSVLQDRIGGWIRRSNLSKLATSPAFSQPTIVSDDQWVLKGCQVSGSSLSATAEGKLRVLWYAAGEKPEHGVYSSESEDGGRTFSPRQLLAATNAHGTPVLLDNGESVMEFGKQVRMYRHSSWSHDSRMNLALRMRWRRRTTGSRIDSGSHLHCQRKE
jgi:hypothetical protein